MFFNIGSSSSSSSSSSKSAAATPPPAAPPVDTTPATTTPPTGPNPTDDDDPGPQEYKPSPKVAVVVAGAALALTLGMTLLVLPFVAQAAKQGHRTEFIAQRSRGRPIRTPVPRKVKAALEAARKAEAAAVGEAVETVEAVEAVEAAKAEEVARKALASASPLTPTSTSASSTPSTSTRSTTLPRDAAPLRSEPDHLVKAEDQLTPAESSVVLTALHLSRAFNDAEEDRLFGPAVLDEEGREVEPASPLLGVYALAIATALVGGCTALGVWGTAKYLGVSNMEEFSARMRANVEESLPALIENVRRESDEPAPVVPDLLDRNHIDIDDNKLRAWVKSWGYGDEDK